MRGAHPFDILWHHDDPVVRRVIGTGAARPRGWAWYGLRAAHVLLGLATAGAIFALAWAFRFNDFDGSLAGLIDDHYFYFARGWQLAHGDLPDRDFFDPGAPLTFVIAAAVQHLAGAGIWSEYAFCATVLALGAALITLLATRASGSHTLGVLAGLLAVALAPRFYNYPKILVYALAIPAIWAAIDKASAVRWVLVALVTVTGFLMRHDHGLMIAALTGAVLLVQFEWRFRERVRLAAIYAAAVLVLLAPYLAYLAMHGGIVRHFDAAFTWASVDRFRAPLVVPSWVWGAVPRDPDKWWFGAPFTWFDANYEPLLFFFLYALPWVGLAVLAFAPDALRPAWGRARIKMFAVALLGILLDASFLRGNIEARVADVSVSHAVLVAWLLAGVAAVAWRGRWSTGRRVPVAVRVLVPVAAIAVLAVVALTLAPLTIDRLKKGDVLASDLVVRRAEGQLARLKTFDRLESWMPAGTPGSMRLAFYLRDCTAPSDRFFAFDYLPFLAPLSGRMFGGGHTDFRPGFFATDADQQLVIERLRAHPTPVVFLPGGSAGETTLKEFPRLAAYLRQQYTDAGQRDLGAGWTMRLLVASDAAFGGRDTLLDWPCRR